MPTEGLAGTHGAVTLLDDGTYVPKTEAPATALPLKEVSGSDTPNKEFEEEATDKSDDKFEEEKAPENQLQQQE